MLRSQYEVDLEKTEVAGFDAFLRVFLSRGISNEHPPQGLDDFDTRAITAARNYCRAELSKPKEQNDLLTFLGDFCASDQEGPRAKAFLRICNYALSTFATQTVAGLREPYEDTLTFISHKSKPIARGSRTVVANKQGEPTAISCAPEMLGVARSAAEYAFRQRRDDESTAVDMGEAQAGGNVKRALEWRNPARSPKLIVEIKPGSDKLDQDIVEKTIKRFTAEYSQEGDSVDDTNELHSKPSETESNSCTTTSSHGAKSKADAPTREEKKGMDWLCTYARELMVAQPGRRFVIGMLLTGRTISV